MATYLILNSLVLLSLVGGLIWLHAWTWTRITTLVFIVMILTTAVFDSLLVSSGIVAYQPRLISGITVGSAPLEDFFYTLVAVILIPSLWKRLGTQHDA